MSQLKLTLALGDYDQTRDLALGRVQAQGLDLTILNYDVEEIFFRFCERLEWEVSELSMGMYTSAVSRGDERFIAIPVFPSRVFRHSSIYIRSDGKIRSAEDLGGKRIGCPQWSQTAGIYVRGWIAETLRIPLGAIRWVQAGVNDPGRTEPAVLNLPDGIRIDEVNDRSLDEMLLSGDLDAIISARPPNAIVNGDERVTRLLPDYRSVEEGYFRHTGIFPIMHTVAMDRRVYEKNRWIAKNLYVALDEAKKRSVERVFDLTAAHVPLPWMLDLAQQSCWLLFPDGNYWPYGIEPNRVTLEAFLRFAYYQGIAHRHLVPEELFAEECLAEIRV